jgi:hypothetical protein
VEHGEFDYEHIIMLIVFGGTTSKSTGSFTSLVNDSVRTFFCGICTGRKIRVLEYSEY